MRATYQSVCARCASLATMRDRPNIVMYIVSILKKENVIQSDVHVVLKYENMGGPYHHNMKGRERRGEGEGGRWKPTKLHSSFYNTQFGSMTLNA